MRIIHYTNNTQKVIDVAVKALKAGELIVFPTETTYGLGADATNPAAIERLLAYKEKRDGKPLSIAVSGKEMAERYVEINDIALNLYKNFLPGPITVISQGKHIVAPHVEAENGSLGIRIPNYPLMLKLLNEYDHPITATGANASYQKRPYTINDILTTLSQRQKDLIGLVIDAGELPHNEPSTVVDTTLNGMNVLRQGDIVLTNFEEYTSHSVRDTQNFAKMLVTRYGDTINHKSIVFALQGDMGTGKTHFTKGIGEIFSIQQTISSPTFILEEDYPFIYREKKNTLVHIDTWRMFSKEEFEDLDIARHIQQKHLIVIEWAEKVYPQVKEMKNRAVIIWIKFSYIDDTTRKILFSDSFMQ